VLSSPEISDLVYGGKGVGSQGDGCVQFVARDQTAQAALLLKLHEMELEPYPLTIYKDTGAEAMGSK